MECGDRTAEMAEQKREGRSIMLHRAQKNGEDWSGLVEKPLGDEATENGQGAPECMQEWGRAALSWSQQALLMPENGTKVGSLGGFGELLIGLPYGLYPAGTPTRTPDCGL